MKAALILLSLFFLMVTFRARAEDTLIIDYNQNAQVNEGFEVDRLINQLIKAKNHLVSQIDTRNLPIRKYLSYGIYKESCIKLGEEYSKVKIESNSFTDHSDRLMRHYDSCRKGVDGLAFLYSQQTTH